MANFTQNITNDFTVYLLSFKDISILSTAQIQGARIGICAGNLDIGRNSKIDSNYLGCKSPSGPGSLTVDNLKCSSPGASFADRGGHATDIDSVKRRIIIAPEVEDRRVFQSFEPMAPEIPGEDQPNPYRKWDWKDDEECLSYIPNVYGREDELIFEGSGGPTHSSKKEPGGGSGGGFISINVEEQFHLNGALSARGENAKENSTSGGGSGGSIQFVTTILKGSGKIDVTGGNGARKNSGGGSAGRVSVRFWKAERNSYPQMTKEWSGKVIKEGGKGHDTGGDGSEGSLYTTKCQAGYSGPF